MLVVVLAFADYLACGHVERCEKRGRAISLVIMSTALQMSKTSVGEEVVCGLVLEFGSSHQYSKPELFPVGSNTVPQCPHQLMIVLYLKVLSRCG